MEALGTAITTVGTWFVDIGGTVVGFVLENPILLVVPAVSLFAGLANKAIGMIRGY